ncbi:peptidylprolyl isomerase [Paenibacillus arenilitoris]|uniref:peptidylprolyl isomerase n=1 Tax=Paenibacillus arenilitoris TaxID=2772299 RepID=A0A927CR62_9BACL|nr:peptidylprolyl isomerase [Paenibacillus arenilitoris]MBD2872639.1 peptidylprolyl isomerase [Paenibacillus arenilitoris]
MRKNEVLKAVVILQAVCMVILAVVVVVKVWPAERLPSHAGEEEPAASGEPGLAPGSDKDAVARVGSDTITAGELRDELYKLHGDTVLRTLMVHKAIDLEAAASGVDVLPEELDRELQSMMEGYESEERFLEGMREQLGMTKDQLLEDVKYKLLLEKIAVRSVNVTDDEVDMYIEEHPGEYAAKERLHLQWILLESERDADAILDSLAGGEDFALLARTYSIDAFTAESGGDLGLIDADDPFYDAEMLDTASRLQIAEMAGPIKVEDGFAIIRLVERQTTEGLTGPRLKEAVRKQLALERADSLNELEDKLLAKYEAGKTD